MRVVCPKLKQWVSFHKTINKIWTKAGSPGTSPPIPPTVEMWASSGDDDKEHEWVLMLEWLNCHDLEWVADFPDYAWYVTDVEYIDESRSSSHSPYGRDPLLNK